MALSSYAQERKNAIRARNEQNKRRSRQMETRIAKYFSGNRVPMSGSGSIKGDCQILNDKYGYILVECKTSAAVDSSRGKKLRISFKWIDELRSDVKAMRAAFGIIVIHYHDTYQDYILVEDILANKLIPGATYTAILDCKDKSGATIYKSFFDLYLKDQFSLIRLETSKGSFIIMEKDYFKFLLFDNIGD